MAAVAKNATEMLFQHSLAEVVRKLRASEGSDSNAIEQYIAATKKEVGSSNQSVKVTAIQKATYFHMLGYDASYANFNIVEVMADTVFANKRVAYVAACLTFTENTDVIPLVTALLKRDLASSNQYEVGLALYCIATVCTPDLAKDLVVDVVNLLSHQRSYVRKKAVLSLYKIFFQYPDSLRPVYAKLKEKLEDNSEHSDTDPAVRGAVVCVLCELARRNPSNFLGLAVPFYSMLTNVHSNWTLIKVVKVFSYFAPLEPRLGKKLVEPLTNLILTTAAKSVQYECILSVANGMSKVTSLTKLAAEKMKLFVEDRDQNIKFLGLDAMSCLMRESPKLLADQRETIIGCLDDPDSTVRRKALALLSGLTSRRNVVSTINHLVDRCVHTPPDEDWSNAVIATVIETARKDDYGTIQDFEWYLGVLLDLSLVKLSVFEHGGLLEEELITIVTRVNAVRQFGVEALAQMLSNSHLLKCDVVRSSQWQILRAAAFACGEYPYWLADGAATCRLLLSEHMALMPAEVQVVCVMAAGKIAAYARRPCARHVHLCNGEEELHAPEGAAAAVSWEALRDVLLPPGCNSADASEDEAGRGAGGLEPFRHSTHPVVQERASLVHYHLTADPEMGPQLFEAELLPVAAGAQDALEPPAGLDLERPFCENIPALMPLTDSDRDDDENGDGDVVEDEYDFSREYQIEKQLQAERMRRQEMDPFYLSDAVRRRSDPKAEAAEEDAAAPAPRRPHGGRKAHAINRNLSKPESYRPELAAAASRRSRSPEVDEATRRLRNIDVTRALARDERLPEAVPYSKMLKMLPGERTTAAAKVAEEEAFPPVTLLDEAHVRVVLYVEDCRARKSGTRLRCQVEVFNVSSGSTLHEVVLRVAESAPFPAGSVVLEAEEEGEAGDEAAAAAPRDRVVIASRVKATCVARRRLTLRFVSPPASLTAPLPLRLHALREKKAQDWELPLPLLYRYFARPAPTTITSTAFTKALEESLGSAPVLAAFLPCSKASLALSVAEIQKDLRLTPVDILKDVMSLYGLLHQRKSEQSQAPVAVLLRDASEGGARGLGVSVKCHSPSLAEAAIFEIASIVQKAQ